MAMSLAAVSHAIHGLGHTKPAHPQGPAGALRRFDSELGAATGPQSGQTRPNTGAGNGPGALLSAQMLQAIQAVG